MKKKLGELDYYVYRWTNSVNGKMYIGKGRGARARNHLTVWKSKNKFCRVFYNSIAKYGVASFSLDFLEQGLSNDEALRREVYWIERLDTLTPKGLNIMRGGTGGPLTEEHKAAIGRGSAAVPRTFEWCAAIGRAHKGKILSPEHKQAVSKHGRKRLSTAEQKAAVSLRMKVMMADPEFKARVAQAAHEAGTGPKLIFEQVQEIRMLLAEGETPYDIAARFGVSRGTIRNIRDGKTWAGKPRNRVSLETERLVLLFLSDGKSKASVSRELGISTDTIRSIQRRNRRDG